MSASPALHPSRQQGEEQDPRRCEKEREDGTRCKAWKVRGEPYCAGHLGLGQLDASRAAKRSAEVRAGTAQARNASLRDLLARQLEENADEIVAALLDVIRTGTHADKLRAIEAWTSRVYGKPTERVEHGPLTEPETDAELRAMSEEDRLALIRQYEGMA